MYEGLIPHLRLQELLVRVEVVFQYLHILKHINPLYRDIEIDESLEMLAILESPEILNIKNVTIIGKEIDLANEEAATGSSVTETSDLEKQITRDTNQARREAIQGIMEAFCPLKQI